MQKMKENCNKEQLNTWCANNSLVSFSIIGHLTHLQNRGLAVKSQVKDLCQHLVMIERRIGGMMVGSKHVDDSGHPGMVAGSSTPTPAATALSTDVIMDAQPLIIFFATAVITNSRLLKPSEGCAGHL